MLHEIRVEFGIPQPEGGIQCHMEAWKGVYNIGEPIRVKVMLRRVSPETVEWEAIDWDDFQSQIQQDMEITGPDGRRIPFGSAVAGEDGAHVRGVPLGGFTGYGVGGFGRNQPSTNVRLDDAYDFSKPGFYTIKARCKVGENPTRYAVSAGVRIRVIPQDFLDLKFQRLNADPKIEKGDSVPMRVRLVTGWEEGEDLSEMRFHFRASENPKPYAEFLGVPRPPENFRRRWYGPRAPWSDKRRAYRADLVSNVYWGSTIEFIGPGRSLWRVREPGTQWRVYAIMHGKLSGLPFEIVSNPIEVDFADLEEGSKTSRTD